jgi:hypothetical protein
MTIKWVIVPCLMFAMFARGALAQQAQHAPTVDVCRADVAVWWTEYIVSQYEKSEDGLASGGKYIRNPAGDLPIKEVSVRMNEMHDCENVDTRDARTYSSAWGFYYGIIMERYQRFVERHGLHDQFMKEDAEGMR